MAEDIGLECQFDFEAEKVTKTEKKKKKNERSAPSSDKTEVKVVSNVDAPSEIATLEVSLTKTAKKKLKRKLAQEKKATDNVEPDIPCSKKEKVDEKIDKKDKAKFAGKDNKLSFEAITIKFAGLLGKLTDTTTKFNEGEEVIKKQVEEGKILKEESQTLLRVYNRNLRIKRLRTKLVATLGENVNLDVWKRAVSDMRNNKKITQDEATRLVKNWKSREMRRVGRKDEKIMSGSCFHCRETGHRQADCPKRNSSTAAGVCFKCGSTEHSIQQCNKKNVKGFPFATCFICKQVGHISRDCHQNQNGVYPDGGCCNSCGSNAHLRRDCPKVAEEKAELYGARKQFNARNTTDWVDQSADADYDPLERRRVQKEPVQKVAKHIKF